MRMIRKADQQLRFQGDIKMDIDNKYGQYLRFTRIKTAFENAQTFYDVGGNFKRLGCKRSQRSNGMGNRFAVFVGLAWRIGRASNVKGQGGEGEFEFSDSQHRGLGVIKQL
jgi:hypothetical protein